MSSAIAARSHHPEAQLANTMPIYLDNQSSTRLDPRVVEAMLPYFTEQFGNPHSTSHAYGRLAAEAIEQARSEVAALINADPRELIFTSGATESNNLAIKGAAHFARLHPRTGQPLSFATDPPADMVGLIKALDGDLQAAQG